MSDLSWLKKEGMTATMTDAIAEMAKPVTTVLLKNPLNVFASLSFPDDWALSRIFAFYLRCCIIKRSFALLHYLQLCKTHSRCVTNTVKLRESCINMFI